MVCGAIRSGLAVWCGAMRSGLALYNGVRSDLVGCVVCGGRHDHCMGPDDYAL